MSPNVFPAKRRRSNSVFLTLCTAAALFGLVFLVLILISLLYNGIAGLSLAVFTEMTPPPGSAGGLLNAIFGSVVMTVIGVAIGAPIGMLAGTYLAEYGRYSKLSSVVRFLNDILLSAPSIIIGLFVYEILVAPVGHFSALAGAVSLAIIVIPIVTRTTEDMLLLVPGPLREAATAMGLPRAHVITKVAYKAARAGLITGVLLGVARVSGETAPLLFTALNNQFFSYDLTRPMASLPTVIFQFALSPYKDWQSLAWTGALLITVTVLLLSIIARALGGTSSQMSVTEMTPASDDRTAIQPKITVKDLKFFYGTTLSLKGISLALAPNRVTAFIGPSGCGKSTLLRVLNRMYSLYPNQRAEGEVLLDGQNILSPDADLNLLRSRVGMVFQKPTPFPMSIYENIAFGIRLYEKANKGELDGRVEQALKGAALWPEVKDKLHASGLGLSGGQQQRLCIARTIALQPEVILLDEPCSALDPISTARIEELIDELKSRFTLAIVTHNMQQAARVSDKTAFMYLGDLIEFDDTRKIFTSPSVKQTQAYITGRFG